MNPDQHIRTAQRALATDTYKVIATESDLDFAQTHALLSIAKSLAILSGPHFER